MPTTRQPVHVNILSTFRDMHAERDAEGKIIRLRPWATVRSSAEGGITKAEGGQTAVSQRYRWVPVPRQFRD